VSTLTTRLEMRITQCWTFNPANSRCFQHVDGVVETTRFAGESVAQRASALANAIRLVKESHIIYSFIIIGFLLGCLTYSYLTSFDTPDKDLLDDSDEHSGLESRWLTITTPLRHPSRSNSTGIVVPYGTRGPYQADLEAQNISMDLEGSVKR